LGTRGERGQPLTLDKMKDDANGGAKLPLDQFLAAVLKINIDKRNPKGYIYNYD